MVETLRKALKWRRQLDRGEIHNQADIARREGVSRASVTQVLTLLRLGPDIQKRLLALPQAVQRCVISEHVLRPIARMRDAQRQVSAFETQLMASRC